MGGTSVYPPRTVLVDVNGNPLTSGVQYTEDSGLGSTPSGTLVMARRDDSLSTLSPVEDDAVGIRVNNRGAIWVVQDGQVALADNLSAPTAPQVEAFPLVYDGSTFDMQRSIQGISTVAASTRETGVAAAGVGPGYTRRFSGSITANAQSLVLDAGGVGSVMVDLSGTWTGTVIFEFSLDGGSTYVTAADMLMVSSSIDVWLGPTGTVSNTAQNGRYRHPWTAGMTHFRVRSTAWTSGTLNVIINGEASTAGMKSLLVGPAPHNIGWSPTAATAQYTTTQTSATLGPTVSSSQRLVVTYIQIQVGGTTAGTLQVYFGTGAYSRGTNKAIFDGEFAPSSTLKPGFSTVCPPGGWIGAADEELKVTDSAAINPLTITVWYYLVAV